MKKILLSLSMASLCLLATTSKAQVIMTQDFEGSTLPSLPAGWSQGSTGTPTAWFTATGAGTTWGSLTGAVNLPAHTKYAVVDDAANPTQLHDTLKSPVFAMGSYTSVWMNYDYFFYSATQTSTGLSESCYVLGSSDGGTTWNIIDTLLGYGWNGSWVTGHTDLNAAGLTGANCKVAFAYSDGGGAILGVAVDNVQILNLTAKDAGLTAISYNSIKNGISANGEPVSFLIQNRGVAITSFDAYYTINGGTPVTQSFTGLSIAPYTSQAFTFTTAIAGAVTGTNTLRVGLPTVNTVANAEPVDTFKTSTFVKASAETQRQGLIEEFSSSTCSPCRAFNLSYDPLCTTLNADVPGSNFNIIKYQMNWPSPGTDFSYNGDGNTRKSYYGVTGIPEHFVNGVTSNVGWSSPFTSTNTTDFTNEAAGSASQKSFIDMAGSYTVDTIKKKLGVTLTVTPHFTKTAGYHVYIACMDKHYQNTANTTGQLDYFHVMRMMLPSASGHAVTSFTDGTAVSYNDTGMTFTNGDWTAGSGTYPVQNSNKFWSSPHLGEMVAFVEEDATKSIMQSIVILPIGMGTPTHNAGVSTMASVEGISLYPNPTSDLTNLTFNLLESGNIHISVIDVAGRTVQEVSNALMTKGANKINISTANLTTGDYIVLIETPTGNRTVRLTVSK